MSIYAKLIYVYLGEGLYHEKFFTVLKSIGFGCSLVFESFDPRFEELNRLHII